MNCPCNTCPPTSPHGVKGIENPVPSNLGFTNCNAPNHIFNCTNRVTFFKNNQPNCSKGNLPLNTIGPKLEISNYQALKGKNGSIVFAGNNPKLIDVPRAELTLLNQPNLTGTLPVGDVDHDQIYTKQISEYGGVYTNYRNINNGMIGYYISKDIADPYYVPNYITPAKVDFDMWIDPMTNMKPEYRRSSEKKYGWDPCNKDECDSYTHDSLEFRQELMEAQSRVINQQRWSNRWNYLYKAN